MAIRKLARVLGASPNLSPVVLAKPPRPPEGSFEACLRSRRSCRTFHDDPIPLDALSRLLFATQGLTGLGGLRAAPSAAALYPFRVYVFANFVEGLAPGLYHYDPETNTLAPRRAGQFSNKLVRAAFDQQEAGSAAVAVLLAACPTKPQQQFAERAERLIAMEAGHIGQNFLLQATALSLGALGISKLDDRAITALARLAGDEMPVYLLLAGPK